MISIELYKGENENTADSVCVRSRELSRQDYERQKTEYDTSTQGDSILRAPLRFKGGTIREIGKIKKDLTPEDTRAELLKLIAEISKQNDMEENMGEDKVFHPPARSKSM